MNLKSEYLRNKLAYCFLIAMCLSACTNSKNPDKIAQKENEAKFKGAAEKDAKAIADVYNSSLFEMNLSYAVKGKATNEDVKLLADSMTMGHLDIDNQLKAMAEKKSISLTTGLTEDQQEDINKMKNKDPESINKEYVDLLIDDHKDAIKKYEKFAQNAVDTDIKAWFENTITILQNHLNMANRCKNKMMKIKTNNIK